MSETPKLFTLEVRRWYAWEMLPGYGFGRYYSPIQIENLKPLKTGRDILRVDFHNMLYAEGVQDFSLKLQVLFRGSDFLVASLIYKPDVQPTRCAIISRLSLDWLRLAFPNNPMLDRLPHDATTEQIAHFLEQHR